MNIRIGTRGSPLALAQAREVQSKLAEALSAPRDNFPIVEIKTSGDKILDRPLSEVGGKGLFTKEIEEALYARTVDIAVHSMKDLETVMPPGLEIGAVLPREDVRDVLLGAESIALLPAGARVGTSAPRRAAQLLHARPDCSVIPFRGNVATRLAKLAAGEADATFLAAAGLNRLGETGTGHPLPADEWLPAPGQGAIAIECRADDQDVQGLLADIDDLPSRAAVMAERALLAALGGNCHSAIAVLTTPDETGLHMHAALFSPDGSQRLDGDAHFAANDYDGPLKLAEELLSRAAPAIAEHFSGPQRNDT